MFNSLAALTLLVPSWLTLQLSQRSPLLFTAMFALLYGVSSASLDPNLGSKTSVLIFIRSYPYRIEQQGKKHICHHYKA